MSASNIEKTPSVSKTPSKPPTSRKKTTRTPIASIRAKCVDCAGGSRAEVKSCELTDCALWPYRLGKRPAGGEA